MVNKLSDSKGYFPLSVKLTDEEFLKISEFIHTNYGIKLPIAKKSLVESRLQKRLRGLGIKSFGEYCKYVLDSEVNKEELTKCVDEITTNETDFFREPTHFDYLVKTILPQGLANRQWPHGKRLSAWSAACSSGEEPYTLAMVEPDG